MDPSKYFTHSQPGLSLKLLIPTWDVVMTYVTVVMVFMASTTVTLQLTKDGLACVAVRCPPQDSATNTMTNGTCEILNEPVMTAFINKECLKSLDTYGQFFAFIIVFEVLAVASVNNLSLVMNPRCSHILQQFADIAKECHQHFGTPEQINSVLNIIRETAASENPNNTKPTPSTTMARNKRIDTSDPTSPSDRHVNLDNDVITKIKTVHHKVKEFGDEQSKCKFMTDNYLIRVFFFIAIPIACIILNILFSFNSSPFKCHLNDQDQRLPIAYDYILCSRHVVSYFETIRWLFFSILILVLIFEIVYLPTLLSFALRNKTIPECCRRKKINIPECCQNDLAYLCHLLKHHNQAEYDSFIRFYTNGGNAPCTEESVFNSIESQAQTPMSYV